jgi:hypothetical protein
MSIRKRIIFCISVTAGRWRRVWETTKSPLEAGFGGQAGGYLVAVCRPAGATKPALFAVFQFGVSDGLPLHVRGRVGPAGAKRVDMVNHIARAGSGRLAGGRAGVQTLEFSDGGAAAGDAAGVVASWNTGGRRSRGAAGQADEQNCPECAPHVRFASASRPVFSARTE